MSEQKGAWKFFFLSLSFANKVFTSFQFHYQKKKIVSCCVNHIQLRLPPSWSLFLMVPPARKLVEVFIFIWLLSRRRRIHFVGLLERDAISNLVNKLRSRESSTRSRSTRDFFYSFHSSDPLIWAVVVFASCHDALSPMCRRRDLLDRKWSPLLSALDGAVKSLDSAALHFFLLLCYFALFTNFWRLLEAKIARKQNIRKRQQATFGWWNCQLATSEREVKERCQNSDIDSIWTLHASFSSSSHFSRLVGDELNWIWVNLEHAMSSRSSFDDKKKLVWSEIHSSATVNMLSFVSCRISL